MNEHDINSRIMDTQIGLALLGAAFFLTGELVAGALCLGTAVLLFAVRAGT